MRERFLLVGAALLALGGMANPGRAGDAGADGPRLGKPAGQDVIRRMDITVAADGTGLPAGSGSVAQGRAIYAEQCTGCHGLAGSGGAADRLTGGVGSLASAKPIRTVASYWPYAPTLFDYIRRAMPLTAPQSLEDDEVYGLVAYLLSIDGIVANDARLDRRSLARVVMPNRDGFVSLAGQHFDGNIERAQSTETTGE
jgi:S-disulfanyl-L-cysteine oxidoreductase SoxD